MKSLNISSKEQALLIRFKNSLKDNLGDNLVSLQLFGSKARGDYKRDSDIDVLLVINEKNPNIENTIYKIIIDLMLETDIYLSVKIFDLKEFHKLNKIPTVFMQKVRQEAVKI